MIQQAGERSVSEEADRADVCREFEAVLQIDAMLAGREAAARAS